MRSFTLRLWPTLTWVRWGIAPALVFMVACLDRGYQTDFWHHLARGRQTVEHHAMVGVDQFTYTIAGQTIRDANWLTQVIYFRLFAWGGLSLVQACNAAVLALTLAVLVNTCRRESGSLRAAAAVGVVAFLGLWQLLLIRPQTISFLLFVLLYRVLVELPRRKLLVIVPPIIMALWVNLHGGFPIGLLLIAGFTLAEFVQLVANQWTRQSPDQTWPNYYLVTSILTLPATLLNPYGRKVYQYVGIVAARATSRHIEEWLPPSMTSMLGVVFAASVVGLLLLFIIAKKRPTIRQAVLILCFLPLACRSTRMVAWWFLIVGPMLAVLLQAILFDLEKELQMKPSFVAGAFVVVLLAACGLCLPIFQAYNPLFGKVRDTHRVESDLEAVSAQLRQPGRVFARLEWGEYLDWSLGPKQRIFMDGRIEAYADPLWQKYCAVTSGQPGWDANLDNFDVKYLLLDLSYHHNLSQRVIESDRWKEAARSGQAVLFVRKAATDGRISVVSHDF